MTRSIGDLVAASVGVTSEPEIQVFNQLTPQDKAIVIASDGLWDRLSNQEITQIVMSPRFLDNQDSDGAVQLLTNESVVRWQKEQGMIDDITIIVAYLNIKKPAPRPHKT
jgi:serine/threonine protein phosphatase PrpC